MLRAFITGGTSDCLTTAGAVTLSIGYAVGSPIRVGDDLAASDRNNLYRSCVIGNPARGVAVYCQEGHTDLVDAVFYRAVNVMSSHLWSSRFCCRTACGPDPPSFAAGSAIRLVQCFGRRRPRDQAPRGRRPGIDRFTGQQQPGRVRRPGQRGHQRRLITEGFRRPLPAFRIRPATWRSADDHRDCDLETAAEAKARERAMAGTGHWRSLRRDPQAMADGGRGDSSGKRV